MESPVFGDIPTDTRLIETLAWRPGEGAANAPSHLARMAASARALGVRFDRAEANAALQAVSGQTPIRCRLTLALDGGLALTCTPLGPTAPEWALALADARLASDDPWLRHKTTNRALYDTCRAALPSGVDELVFLNERGEVCEGTITNLFVRLDNGRQVTPLATCGVLPGVLRARLLARGDWAEQVLTPADLRSADAIWVGNALRGLIRARFRAPGGADMA